MSSTDDLLTQLLRKKNRARLGNKSRKHRRQYRYYGIDHSQTLYRSRGQREKNKARRAAQRQRLQSHRMTKNGKGIYLTDDRTEKAADQSAGSGSS